MSTETYRDCDGAPLRVGDLVMLVRGHECALRIAGGGIYPIFGFRSPTGGGWRCDVCGKAGAGPDEVGAQLDLEAVKKGQGTPVSWLKRLDPLPESDSISARREVIA